MNKISQWLIGICMMFIAALIVTNPTISDFERFRNRPNKEERIVRLHNYLIFSIYRDNGTDGTDYYSDTYIGFLNSFFKYSSWIT
jgi:hypothetical protein